VLFRRGVPGFENVANLERLPAKGFTVVALPMKIAGGSGGPLRIVAVVGKLSIVESEERSWTPKPARASVSNGTARS